MRAQALAWPLPIYTGYAEPSGTPPEKLGTAAQAQAHDQRRAGDKSQAVLDARAVGRAAAHEALPKTEAIGEDETHCPAPRNDCEAPSSLRYTSQDTESAATSGDRYEQNLASSRHLGPRCQCPGYAAARRRAGTNSWPVVAQRGPRTDGSTRPFDARGASAHAGTRPKQHDRQSQRCDQCQQRRAVPGHSAYNNGGGGSVWCIGSDC